MVIAGVSSVLWIIMFTWRLWRALNNVQFISPLFRRIVLRREMELRLNLPRARWVQITLRIILPLLPILLLFFILPMLVLLYFGIQALSPILVPLAYSIYGLALTLGVTRSIAREYELNTYQSLGVTPPGRIGMHWLYCVSWLHRSYFWRIAVALLIFLGIVAALLGTAIPIIFRADDGTIIQPFIRAASSGIFFAIDFVQTTVIASLFAMLAPAYTHNRVTAQQIGGGGFVAIQLLSYITVMVAGVLLYRTADNFFYPLFIIGIFALLREGIIIFLWQVLHNELSSTPRELRF